jgi:hypothetical protein
LPVDGGGPHAHPHDHPIAATRTGKT